MEEQEHQLTQDQAKPEGLLHHYTDEKGLLGILESGNIWATHYLFLNDQSELQEAPALLFTAIDQMILNDPVLSSTYWNGIRGALKHTGKRIASYLVSFTEDSGEKGDRLSQWRGYSSNRPGFSLGFNRDRLKSKAEEVMSSEKLPTNLWKCLYDDEPKRALIRNSAETHAKAVKEWVEQEKDNPRIADKEYRREELRKHLEPLQEKLLELSAKFKHSGFREENEWRLVFYVFDRPANPDLIHYREGFFRRTPYIRIPLGPKDPDSPLERIVVGPAQDKEQSVARLRIDLAKLGIQGVEVVPSKIPYRNW
jgi:hypothetical protein